MPITSSAKKALRASKKKRVFNLRHKSAIESSFKNIRKAIMAKDKAGATKLASGYYKAVDKAAKIGYIKANTASRKKSRIMAAIAKI